MSRRKGATAALWPIMFQHPSTASAGLGSCAFSTRLIASIAGANAMSSTGRSRVSRRKAGRQQHPVLLAQRQVEPVGQPQHHVARRRRAAAFDEAQMALRDVGLEREVELAHAAAAAPFADEVADRRVPCVHAARNRPSGRRDPLPREVIASVHLSTSMIPGNPVTTAGATERDHSCPSPSPPISATSSSSTASSRAPPVSSWSPARPCSAPLLALPEHAPVLGGHRAPAVVRGARRLRPAPVAAALRAARHRHHQRAVGDRQLRHHGRRAGAAEPARHAVRRRRRR